MSQFAMVVLYAYSCACLLANTKDIQQNAKKSFLGISIWTRGTCLIKKLASSNFRVALSLEEANT
jgi:hypothetical protein